MPCLAYQYQTRKVFGKSSNHYFAVPFSVTTRGADMTHFSFNCVGFLWQFLRSLLLGHSPPKNKKRTLRYRMKAARFSHQSFSCQKLHNLDDWSAFHTKHFYGDQCKGSFFISLQWECNWTPILFVLFYMDILDGIMYIEQESLSKSPLKPAPYPRRSIITTSKQEPSVAGW